MARYYATRTQTIARNVTEHQLLSFPSQRARDRFVDLVGGNTVPARDAKKLYIADVWRTCVSEEADCVFSVARYLPA